MTIEEKKTRISQLRRGKKNFEQSIFLCIAAACFVIYEIYQAATKDSPDWYFYLFMGAITAAMAGIAFWNYRKSQKASAEIKKLIEEIKTENPEEQIPEDTDQRRFF
ncbi:MAG: hypothetical protein WCR31_02760 [Treponema sp.]